MSPFVCTNKTTILNAIKRSKCLCFVLWWSNDEIVSSFRTNIYTVNSGILKLAFSVVAQFCCNNQPTQIYSSVGRMTFVSIFFCFSTKRLLRKWMILFFWDIFKFIFETLVCIYDFFLFHSFKPSRKLHNRNFVQNCE